MGEAHDDREAAENFPVFAEQQLVSSGFKGAWSGRGVGAEYIIKERPR
jgi:hypothetical protein